jgi:hypothetical protein
MDTWQALDEEVVLGDGHVVAEVEDGVDSVVGLGSIR